MLDLGRVRAAGALVAPDNRIDSTAAATIGTVLAHAPHQLTHLVLANTGMRSGEALSLLRNLHGAPVRIVLGKGIATAIRRQFEALAASVTAPAVPVDAAAVKNVHRTAAARPIGTAGSAAARHSGEGLDPKQRDSLAGSPECAVAA